MMKDLGARAFNYGYASPVLMVATYNDDGSVNVMNLHECTRTNAGHLALCIGKPKKTHENIEKRGAFTLTLATKEMMAEVDYMGTVSGYRVPDKFEKAGMKAVKSDLVDAPIIVGSKVVLECEVIEFVDIPNFNCIVARVVNLKADESVLGANSKIDTSKIGMIFYESFNSCVGTGGNDGEWSGNIASSKFKADNSGWTSEKSSGADRCAKFGTGSVKGTATTPTFTVNGTATLTFRAAPWGTDGTTLALSVSDGSISPSSVTMKAGEWTTFTATITATGNTKVTFTPSKRFFLDEVLAVDPTATGIKGISITERPADNRIYSIDGRYVGNDLNILRPGIYIVGGRKVVR